MNISKGSETILEAVILNVRPEESHAFELAFTQAQTIISSMSGYVSHELRRCIEVSGKYILLVYWQTLEDHTVGFRQSPNYEEWKKLLHHVYEPFPTVEHYQNIKFS